MSAVRPLRIAYLVSRLDPGGAEGQMLALAERLPHEEFAVDFICTSEAGVHAPRAVQAGARVFSLGESPSPTAGPLAAAVHRARKIARLIRLLRTNRYDVVDGWMYPSYDLAALSRPVTRARVVIAGRRNMRGPETRYGAVERAVDRIARRLCDMTVANSHAAARFAIEHERLDAGQVRVIHNGVVPLAPGEAIDRNAVREQWGAARDDVVIGCVANLREVKNHALLLDAVADLLQVVPGVHLVLVGEGPMRAPIQRQVDQRGVGPRVVLLGQVPEARRLYPAFDLVALTSLSEGLPNTLLEAAAAGLPAVATDVGGVREVVIDKVTGRLVESGDRAGLAAALRDMATSRALREQMGAAAREWVGREFGMERFVGEFATLYRELSARSRAAA